MNSIGTTLLVGLAGIAMAGTAVADNCSGTWHNVGYMGDTQDIGGGVKLTTFAANSANAYNETGEHRLGMCTGYVLTRADGKVRLVYSCARKNAAGDVAVDEGSLEPGADRGTWKITTASGALMKTIGDSGWWQAKIDNGKVTSGVWGGTCQ